jgi:hypothetical protein
MLTGDVNLMNVVDPQVRFARVQETLRQADVLFGNLECCLGGRGRDRQGLCLGVLRGETGAGGTRARSVR